MMNDFLTEDTKATILLCGVFGKERSEKPLSLAEYSSLVRWLIEMKMCPGELLQKKNILEDKAPPLLFGVGDRSLLNGGGLGIVGSRNVDKAGEAFTRQVAELCADNRIPVVSGVDQISMTAALEAGALCWKDEE